MNSNQYFIDLREKFDVMEKHVTDIKDMVTKIRTSLNELSKDLENGRVSTIEEAKRRVDSIRMFGTEIPPKGFADHVTKEDTPIKNWGSRPTVSCKLVGDLIVPLEVGVSFDDPIRENMEKDGVRGVLSTIMWFISHLIAVDVTVCNSEDKVNMYSNAMIIGLHTNTCNEETVNSLSFGGNVETVQEEFPFQIVKD